LGDKEQDAKEQEMLRRTAVALGSDPLLLHKALANSKAPVRSPEEQKSYDERIARLQAAFEARKKKLSEKQ